MFYQIDLQFKILYLVLKLCVVVCAAQALCNCLSDLCITDCWQLWRLPTTFCKSLLLLHFDFLLNHLVSQ
jgi:hypothetical protein